MTNTQHSAHIHDDAKRRHATKYGTANGLVAAWVPCILGFAVAGPLGAIGGALIGNKLARAIDLGNPNGRYTDET